MHANNLLLQNRKTNLLTRSYKNNSVLCRTNHHRQHRNRRLVRKPNKPRATLLRERAAAGGLTAAAPVTQARSHREPRGPPTARRGSRPLARRCRHRHGPHWDALTPRTGAQSPAAHLQEAARPLRDRRCLPPPATLPDQPPPATAAPPARRGLCSPPRGGRRKGEGARYRPRPEGVLRPPTMDALAKGGQGQLPTGSAEQQEPPRGGGSCAVRQGRGSVSGQQRRRRARHLWALLPDPALPRQL